MLRSVMGDRTVPLQGRARWCRSLGVLRVFALSPLSLRSVRSRWVLLAVVSLVALLGSLLAVVSPPQPAQAVATGTGGQFVPLPTNARIFDGATPAGSSTAVPVAGVKGIPASGVGAISVLATVADANGTGQLKGRAESSDGATLLMIYGSGVAGNTSNTSLVAVGDDGSIRIDTTTAQSRVILDVTG